MRTLVNGFGVCVLVMLVAGTNTAQASTLLTTGQSYLGTWQGGQNFTGVGFFGGTLNADVEWAVFAPGDFQGFLNENGIVFNDPAPSEFIYAYQVVNIVQGVGSSNVTNVSVGLNSNESLGISGVTFIPFATNYGAYPLQPIRDPGGTGGGPGVSSSSVWPATPGSSFAPGEVTPILFYSSPQVPELGFSTVNAGLAAQTHATLPNPVPEPATLVLCLVAGLGMMARRRL